MTAHDFARSQGGAFLLRIEDIDRQRSKPGWEAALLDDLAWLGLTWDGPVLRQSDRLGAYRDCLQRLWGEGAIYACNCRRRDVIEAASAPNEGEPVMGPDGIVYPGTCRPADPGPRSAPMPPDSALRLDIGRAFDLVAPDGVLTFTEDGAGPAGETGAVATTRGQVVRGIGDVVLARREFGTSYHLSVVLDDAAQGVTHVVRGRDLFEATRIHAILQRLLGLPRPVYRHHRLIRDETGRRLAKRDDARALSRYRAEGATPQDIRRMVGL